MSIEDYEFSNLTTFAETNQSHDDEVYLQDADECFVVITKRDVIQLAKHFKLTSDDLDKDK